MQFQAIYLVRHSANSVQPLMHSLHFVCVLASYTLSMVGEVDGTFIPGERNKIWGAAISSGHVYS